MKVNVSKKAIQRNTIGLHMPIQKAINMGMGVNRRIHNRSKVGVNVVGDEVEVIGLVVGSSK